MRQARGWIEATIHQVIRGAARRAPGALAARLEEEWLADLAGRHGLRARVRFALGCCRATRVIALELAAPAGAAAAGGGKTAALFADPTPFLPRRTMVVVLIGALHTLVILGLAAGMAREVFAPTASRMQVALLPKSTSQPATPPAFGAPAFQHVEAKATEVPPISAMDEEPQAAAATATDSGPPSAALTTARVTRVTGGPGQGFPNTADYYPATSLRLEEQGVAAVRVCVDGVGRLTADPAIDESSGSTRLDAAALRLARAGSGHYQPTTENGRPVSSCYSFGVRFQLQY